MHSYEVEVKSLLGNAENADALRMRLQELDSHTACVSKNKQLNHYFVGGDIQDLEKKVRPHLTSEAQHRFTDLVSRAKEFSLRTRDKDGTVFLVFKASVGDDTSANGVSRLEFEEKVPLSLDALDQLVLSAGFSYQAKWSREREEYLSGGINVCLDRNAGYGWLAEFEKVVDSEVELAQAREDIKKMMGQCGVEELGQGRLERMFAFYNEHWPEYYGTEKIFIIQ